MTRMIGARHCLGRPTNVSISESPEVVAGNPAVTILTVATFPLPSPLRQLTSARNCASSLVPRTFRGTEGSLANTTPLTLIGCQRASYASHFPRYLVSDHAADGVVTDERTVNTN